MCLALPGKVISIDGTDPHTRMGKVAFAGIVTEACLCFVPEAGVGDYVLVHAGFAIAQIDEAEAERSNSYLEQLNAMAESDGRL